MIALHIAWYDLCHFLRKQRMRRLLRQYRRQGARAGLPSLDGFSDTAIMVGLHALRRMKETGETYEAACVAVFPLVTDAALTDRRDIAAIGSWLAE